MEAQNDNPSWADQTEELNFQLPYTIPKEGMSNNQDEANGTNNIPPTHVEGANTHSVNVN